MDELPFAVDYSATPASTSSNPKSKQQEPHPRPSTRNHADGESLVTASSQGSLLHSEAEYTPIPRLVSAPYSSTTITAAAAAAAAATHSSSASTGTRNSQRQFQPAASSLVQQDDNDDGLEEVLSQYGVAAPPSQTEAEFTYVNVRDETADVIDDEIEIVLASAARAEKDDYDEDEDDDGVYMAATHRQGDKRAGDVLALLLTGPANREADALVQLTEQANQAVTLAAHAKKQGNMQKALDAHAAAAHLFKNAAVIVMSKDAALANSFLLLSQTHARSALALKRVMKLHPSNTVQAIREQLSTNSSNSNNIDTHKERLRATVRGGLENKPQADISNSTFLGRATKAHGNVSSQSPATASEQQETDMSVVPNPVDEMMQLEKELNSMDMTLSMGSSIVSLDIRTQNRMKSSMVDGSFMVVQPGSNSFLYSPHASPPRNMYNSATGTANARARANRVQTILDATSATARPPVTIQPSPQARSTQPPSNGLEASWLGSNASLMLASSIISVANTGGRNGNEAAGSANSKQLLRLMDSLKTLGDENASLLREVQGAEKARLEAKAAKEQMRRFKEEYAKKFDVLKDALEKFRKNNSISNASVSNPVAGSEFLKSASVSEQLQRQEQLIKKLTADLTKEKEDNKKKDAALRKYETFYREVKARSAQKAAQRQKETPQHRQHQLPPFRPTAK